MSFSLRLMDLSIFMISFVFLDENPLHGELAGVSQGDLPRLIGPFRVALT